MRFSSPVIFLFLLWSCASAPWSKFPISEKPDITCQTGYEGGYDIWAWNCYKGEHIVVWRWSSSFYGGPAHQEIVKCGEQTGFEKFEAVKDWGYPKCSKSAPTWNSD